jgi:hypothetical protein
MRALGSPTHFLWGGPRKDSLELFARPGQIAVDQKIQFSNQNTRTSARTGSRCNNSQEQSNVTCLESFEGFCRSVSGTNKRVRKLQLENDLGFGFQPPPDARVAEQSTFLIWLLFSRLRESRFRHGRHHLHLISV